jgi:hypothetical protein
MVDKSKPAGKLARPELRLKKVAIRDLDDVVLEAVRGGDTSLLCTGGQSTCSCFTTCDKQPCTCP